MKKKYIGFQKIKTCTQIEMLLKGKKNSRNWLKKRWFLEIWPWRKQMLAIDEISHIPLKILFISTMFWKLLEGFKKTTLAESFQQKIVVLHTESAV